MNSLPVLPVFLKLAAARVVLAGDGDPAAWKLELLAAAGADLVALAPEPGAKLEAAARRAGVPLVRRRWRDDDLAGARVALLETADDGEAERFRAAARAAGALVNVIDRPDFCDFSFGSIVERAPLVIAISTDGAAPVFAQAARARIEAMFPDSLRAWAEAARAWRPRFSGFDQSRRRALWLDFAERAFASAGRAPREEDVGAILGAERRGRLILVGTGGGAPDDLTLRAVRALQAADRVIEDGPHAPALRDLGRREAAVEAYPDGADARVKAAARARVEAGEIVVVLVRGEGRGTTWEGAEIVAGLAP